MTAPDRRAKPKAAHHRGNYDVQSRRVVARAKADPSTRCWRCGRTLRQHPLTKSGRPPRWSAGHVVDGQAGGKLLPEVLSCNSSAGASYGNRLRDGRAPAVPKAVKRLPSGGRSSLALPLVRPPVLRSVNDPPSLRLQNDPPSPGRGG